jgi:hypothetical protein
LEGSEKRIVAVFCRIKLCSVLNIIDQLASLHGVIQDSIHNLLIGTCIVGITVENLAYAVDARGFVIARPEGLLDMFDRVDAETIDFALLALSFIQMIAVAA